MLKLFKKFLGSSNERELGRLQPLVQHINDLESTFEPLSDEQLKAKTPEFRERIESGESLESLLPEAFAVVREASKRVLGMRHFNVQLLGGVVLHRGIIAEMKTGEGKTLTATLPVYLNALTGKGVHLVTVNDYLARRDAEWMATIYSYLGLSTGVIHSGIDTRTRKAAYDADITYGQNNEFGFDYLRDNMKLDLFEKVQRDHYFAIVDEVDSILIDESRTPLIISGPSEKPTENYYVANTVVGKLTEEDHFTIDLKSKSPSLTEDGVHEVEKLLELENLYDPRNIELVHLVNQSLRAHYTMKRDTDYVVRDNQVVIVDEFTGRLMAGRRWSDGLHQAVEAKEGVEIQRENQTLATITFQNYFRMYDKLAGMTGTADTEAVEFKQIYDLDVMVIPTNEPLRRKDYSDIVFPNERGKFRAVCQDIISCYERGQPVLVGTASIAKSEAFGEVLKEHDVPHHVLNAKYHEQEAEIVAQAGRIKAVTISTNMAGRGTDILLGGNPEFLAIKETGTDDPEDVEFRVSLEKYKDICEKEKQQVLDLGGLHIIGTERHESRRIDNQLRGRSGRQGDPGSSRFYISFEDDLMKRFGGDRMQAIMAKVNVKDDDAIEGRLVARSIESSQKKVEGMHFEQRKQLLEFDNVMNKQREVVYTQRERILRKEESDTFLEEIIGDVVEEIIMTYADEKLPVAEWNITEAVTHFSRQFAIELDPKPYLDKQEESHTDIAQVMFDEMQELALTKYRDRKERTGPENMAHIEQVLHLQAIDHFWKEHLTHMAHLREGIFLRSYAQEKPIHVYQREGYELFVGMNSLVKSNLVANLFIPELPSAEEISEIEEREKERVRQLEQQAQAIHEGEQEEEDELQKDGLNRAQRRKKKRANKKKR